MTYEFKLPDIGEGVVEGEVVRWLVKEGGWPPTRVSQPRAERQTRKIPPPSGVCRHGLRGPQDHEGSVTS